MQSPWWWVSPCSPYPYAPTRPSWSPSARHAVLNQSARGRSCSTKTPPLACKLVQSRVSTSCDAHPCSPPRLAVPPGRGAASRHVDRSGVEHAAALVPARGCVNEEDDEGGRRRACFMRRMRTRDVGLALKSAVTSSLRGRLRFRTASGESDAVPN